MAIAKRVARRAADKRLDPGKLDHLVGGGVAAGMGFADTLAKEAEEEAGLPPELAARAARVDRFDLVERVDAETAVFEVQSGKGVYMRSLARDLAAACGALGHVAALRRLRVGPFTEAQAISLDRASREEDRPPASPDLLLPVLTALADIPALALTEHEAIRFTQGQAVSLVDLMGRIPELANPDGGLARAMAGERVIGLCRLEDGWLKPERLL